MIKDMWLNISVKDVMKSREFFTALGFEFNDSHGVNADSACLICGEGKSVIMLFREDMFKGFIRHEVTDTEKSSEILIDLQVDSRADVDEIAEKVKIAGGTVFAEPEEVMGWMYGCAFCDLDNHRWNILYMDTSKINK